ncbi:hypothetical protein Pfra02_25590 [Pseudomonas fragi]|nr:hypothetical protein Pfra02_25590 [Pseudomonas fragi]
MRCSAGFYLGDIMLKQLNIKEFTVFEEANLRFGKQLNVIVGENGAGKTHLLNLWPACQ